MLLDFMEALLCLIARQIPQLIEKLRCEKMEGKDILEWSALKGAAN